MGIVNAIRPNPSAIVAIAKVIVGDCEQHFLFVFSNHGFSFASLTLHLDGLSHQARDNQARATLALARKRFD
jgi:hypothetical protein